MTIPEDRYRNIFFMDQNFGMPDPELRLLTPPGENRGPCHMPDLSEIDDWRARFAQMTAGYYYAGDTMEIQQTSTFGNTLREYMRAVILDRRAMDMARYYGADDRRIGGYFRRSPLTIDPSAFTVAEPLTEHPDRDQERITALVEQHLNRLMAHRLRDRILHEALRSYLPQNVDYSPMAADAFFGVFPVFADEEQAREWFESMGAAWPTDGPNPWSVSRSLGPQAKTLRERAFAQVLQGVTGENMNEVRLWCHRWEGSKTYKLDLKGKKLRNILAAARRDPEARRHLAALPIAKPAMSSNANDELSEPLQDLADIIVHEVTLAYEEEYYPRPVSVDALTDEHVVQVMQAMQREIDRERRGVRQAKLEEDLPWERQVALAERRRHWFEKFGITPKSWRTGHWSLWKVPNEPFPEGYKCNDSTDSTPDVAHDQNDNVADFGNPRGQIGPDSGPDWTGMINGRTVTGHALPGGRVDTVVIDDPINEQAEAEADA